jgi:hypothetical protein
MLISLFIGLSKNAFVFYKIQSFYVSRSVLSFEDQLLVWLVTYNNREPLGKTKR